MALTAEQQIIDDFVQGFWSSVSSELEDDPTDAGSSQGQRPGEGLTDRAPRFRRKRTATHDRVKAAQNVIARWNSANRDFWRVIGGRK